MGNSKHTKGEWKQDSTTVFIRETHRIGIASIYPQQIDEEQEANAKLIAAAPELLEACLNVNNLYSELERMVDGDVLKMLDKV